MGDRRASGEHAVAERVLALLGGNDTGRYITPSRHQYQHQWLWDSCFHAILLAPLDAARARQELASLLDEQRDDGMIPHIRFGAGGDDDYRPNAADWGTGRSSSGITQPPLVAVAARVLHERGPDRAFLERIYPAIARYHGWMQATRDPGGCGLVTVVHPWESGCDNSPVYDDIRDTFVASGRGVDPPARVDTDRLPAAQRPRADDYRFYWGLIVGFQELGWAQDEMARRSPCRVADVTFNSIWARANEDLASIARELGRQADADRFDSWAERTARALRSTCWSDEDGLFLSYDQARGQRISVATVSGFLPLLSGAPSPDIAAALVDTLLDRRRFGGAAGVPSTAFDEPAFDPRNYWRGPAWNQMHWLLADGLRRHGYDDVADDLAERSLALVEVHGYREYYDPFSGEGLGAADFCWSALAHRISTPPPPAVFTEPRRVLALADIEADPELRTLYAHPESREVAPEDVVITSTPQPLVDRILADAAAAAGDRRATDVSALAERLAAILAEHLARGDGYPRRCDVGVLAVARAGRAVGLPCRTMWAPDLHYYSVVGARSNEELVVDLTAAQFSSHPASRLPLLVETTTLALTTPEESGPVAVMAALRDGRARIGSYLATQPPIRLAAAERAAFSRVYARHREHVDRIPETVTGPRQRGRIDDYLSWLEATIAPIVASRPGGAA